MKLAIQICLILSALLLAIAPRFMGPAYNWLIHSISESAAQNTENGWIARTGFALYGVAIIAFSFAAPAPSNWRYLPFGLAMILVGIWSNAPYVTGRTFDAREDTLHSLASALVGMSFILAVISSLLADRPMRRAAVAFDIVALLAAAAVPLIMSNMESIRGLAQRVMFLTSYVWFFVETQSRGVGEAQRSSQMPRLKGDDHEQRPAKDPIHRHP
jgi:hypothetical protein